MLLAPALPTLKPPAWCHSTGANCIAAERDFNANLAKRYGLGWSRAQVRIEDCPPGPSGSASTIVECMAYFRAGRSYRFAMGDITAHQATTGGVTYYPGSLVTWKRRWRTCKLEGPTVHATLQSNEPCNTMPLDPSYTAGAELTNGRSVIFQPTVGWQFTDSADYFPAMKPVGLATCNRRAQTITCTDAEGDAFRLTAT